MASRVATAMAMGITSLKVKAPARPKTKRISCVAYALEESGSEEKTGRAIVLGRRVCSSSPEAIGLPRKTLFNASVLGTRDRQSLHHSRLSVLCALLNVRYLAYELSQTPQWKRTVRMPRIQATLTVSVPALR